MATGIRGTPTGGATSGTTSAALTIPATAQAGDVAYFAVEQAGGQATTINATNTWTTSASLQAWNGSTQRLTIYKRVLDATDPGTTISASWGSSQQHATGLIVVSGGDGTEQISTALVKTTASTTNAHNPVTPNANDAMVLYFDASQLASNGTTPQTQGTPTSYTEDLDVTRPSGTNLYPQMAFGHRQLVGQNGVAQTPSSVTVTASVISSSLTLAIPPAATSTPISASDTGTLSEGASAITATVAGTDTGTLGEGAGGPSTISISRTDAATLTDANAGIALSRTEQATLTEGTSQIGVSTSDTGTLSEASSTAASPAGTDTGTLSEASSLTQIGTTPTASDSFALAEAATITSTLAATEAIGVLEAATVAAQVGATDSAGLSETAATAQAAATVDTFTFTEALATAAPFVPPALGLGSLDDLIWGWFTARAVGRSSADAMYFYFSARSGLPANRAVTDHMVAYYAAALGVANPEDVPLTDLEITFWQSVDPTNNFGSWAVRAQKFYGA